MYIIQYASSSSNKTKILPRYQRISCAMHNSDLFLPILQCLLKFSKNILQKFGHNKVKNKSLMCKLQSPLEELENA